MMDASQLKILAEKQKAAAAARLKVELDLLNAGLEKEAAGRDRQRSAELDGAAIEVIANGHRFRKPIKKCTREEIEAYADRCEFEAKRAREYLAKRRKKA